MRDSGHVDEMVLSVVYVSSDRRKKWELWDQLGSLAADIHLSWLIGGDFNFILAAAEKIGGSGPDWLVVKDFSIFRDDLGLMDLGFEGS